ncbi:hypothetical protein GC425_01385 [Corynebacterium sp. zg254]|uniref:Protein adenylyltransferase SelO n=1 Tax=Corynebacterium zhongnanshanii TaxID=2768834 RepID=A0ABQ6VG08_9CORY|nr:MULTISPECIES: protein adenylyltransferase SelO family protein [Corynebacterium]KAB3523352.1 hypothetical protein F8377_04245 [Corynebacterium zhongnanshanii]MCR5913525.1 hypothetical protein [Corynebacterium sp. zg254]
MQLTHDFAQHFPELCRPTVGEEFPEARMLIRNDALAAELGCPGIDVEDLLGKEGFTMAYSGHQFGQFSPILGDGRSMLLGELGGYDLHLKGSGRTPFTQLGADGRLPLIPALREYVISEFLHTMGVPTTRVLAVIATGERLTTPRGTAGLPFPPGAVLVRVARHHIRIGTFQCAAMFNPELVQRLESYAAQRSGITGPLFPAVVERQATLVAQWMRLGFVHGALNTDNVHIAGDAIDFGPCGFMDAYDPEACFSSVDTGKRYAFNKQPAITQWNLARLAEALTVEDAEEHLRRFPDLYSHAYDREMTDALGPRWEEVLEECGDYPTALGHVVPRNHALQDALNRAEAGDMEAFNDIVEDLRDPYAQGKKSGITSPGDTGFTSYCGT